MKFLIKFLYVILIFSLLAYNNIKAQVKDSLIELYPGLGDGIENLDREYFGIFKGYDDFEKAAFYIRDNKYLVIKIKCFEQSSLNDAILVQELSALDSLRNLIKKIESADDKSDLKSEVTIVTKTGDRYEGKLEMFSKKYFYLYSDKSFSTGGTKHLRIKVPVSNVEAVILPGESNTLAGMGWGALAGLLIGLGVSSSVKQHNFWIYDAKMMVAGFFALLGAGIGALIGLGASTSDEVIEITSISSLIQLKELCRYNPGDKSPPGINYYLIESL